MPAKPGRGRPPAKTAPRAEKLAAPATPKARGSDERQARGDRGGRDGQADENRYGRGREDRSYPGGKKGPL